MNSLWSTITSSIGKKLIIGFTGVCLILFVVGHLAGNLTLYAGLEVYNDYAHALHENPNLLHFIEIGLLTLFVLHIVLAIQVTREHRRARPQHYKVHRSKQGRSSITASAIMIFSGVIVLGFVLLHLADLRFNLRHPVGPNTQPAAHTLLVLQDPVSAIVYFFGSIFLGYHLWHAFESVFQTYGLEHERYTPWIKKIGIVLAILLAVGFASFPVWGMLIKFGVLS